MKKILFVAGISLAGLSVAFAQNAKLEQKAPATQNRAARGAEAKPSPESMAQRRTDRLDKELSLTGEQKQKVHDLFLKEAQENNGRAIQRKEAEEQLKAIFTAEQNQKYESLKAQRKQLMMERRQGTNQDLKAAPGLKAASSSK